MCRLSDRTGFTYNAENVTASDERKRFITIEGVLG